MAGKKKEVMSIAPVFSDVRVTELGKIKIGGLGDAKKSRAGGSYRVPKKYDHFIITTMNRGPDVGGARGDLLPDEALMSQLKAETRYCNDAGNLIRLPVYLLSNEISDIMQSAFVWYGGKSVGARAEIDFTTDPPVPHEITWFNDRANGKKLGKPVTEPWDEEFTTLTDSKGNALLKLHTIFNCVIAAHEARWGGVYKFRTTSIITAKQLYSGLVNLSALTTGVLTGLPMQLFVRPVQVSPDGKATTVHVVGVEMLGHDIKEIMDRALDMAKVMLERGVEVQRIQAQQRKMLIAPGFESDADAGDINAEFQPETVEDMPDGEPDAEWAELVNGEDAKPEAPDEDAPPDEDESQARVCSGCGNLLTHQDEGEQCATCLNFDGQSKGQQGLL